MNAVKGYEKILPGCEPSQHSKKISLLLAACFVILVATAGSMVVGFLHGKNTQSSDLIEALCKKTLYVEICNSSLRGHPGALQANASQLARIAVEVSRDVAEDVVQLTLDLNRTAGDDAPGSVGPLADCVGLLGDGIDELNDSLSAMADGNWRRRSGDVKTWLSAALTNSFTCIDGFEEEDVSMPRSLKQKVEYLTQLISNGLAIINYVAGFSVVDNKILPPPHPHP